jgi:hypothetical protein
MTRILITGADKSYYLSLISLIRSLYDTSNFDYPLVIVDLGFTKWQKIALKSNLPSHYQLIELPEEPLLFKEWANPNTKNHYAWKAIAIRNAISKAQEFIWIDAGVLVTENLQKVFNEISSSGYYLMKNEQYLNHEWTSKLCIEVMRVSTEELNSPHIMANFFGISKVHPKGKVLLEDWMKWCQVEEAIKGDRSVHRHDQSILSVLSARHGLTPIDCNFSTRIGRFISDYKASKLGTEVFVSHRNWLYLRPSHLTLSNPFNHLDATLRHLPLHGKRLWLKIKWKLRWSMLGSEYVLIRNKSLNFMSKIRNCFR